MSSVKVASMQKEIASVIRKFKFEEMESLITLAFPELSWSNIKARLVKQRKTCTPSNVAQIVTAIVTEAKLQEKVLKDRISTLRLIDVSWHSTKRIWYGYTLTGSNKSAKYLTNGEIRSNMQGYFDSLTMKINVKANSHDNVTYISLTKEKPKSKKGKEQRPVLIFVALFVGQKYFFCTRKDVSSTILNAVVTSLGYRDSKRFKLMGRNLKSLNELCWKKKEGATSSENITKTVTYKDASPERKSTGINFTQQRQRKKYAEECFGDDAPTLELLVVNGPSLPIAHEELAAKLPNVNMRITWEFRSQNIVSCLSKLIERRVLTAPVPHYISNLITLGKNELTVENC